MSLYMVVARNEKTWLISCLVCLLGAWGVASGLSLPGCAAGHQQIMSVLIWASACGQALDPAVSRLLSLEGLRFALS